ncbi:sugar ABC transporter substrate-binding protein [Nonomuraea lactucae]|uniref:sugar ABC transporter substrate-binding protein n=1 Tax=Nonomuraea lactucae TaxID=2249762 RepID=UPI0013B38131|nr:substrate-binding domain-containing protein [Nonomuraea lactucae]
MRAPGKRSRNSLGRLTAALASLSLCVIAAAGCSDGTPAAGNGGAPAGESLDVAFASPNDQSAQFAGITQSMRTYAGKLGYALKVHDNQGTGTQALANARVIANAKPDVVIDWTLDAGVGKSLGAAFNRAGVPCIAMNTEIPGCSFFNISNSQYGTEGGTNLAAAAKSRGWDATNTTYIGVNFAASGPNPLGAIAHGFEAFSKSLPGAKPVQASEITAGTTRLGDNYLQVDGGGTIEGTFNALKATLQGIPSDRNLAVFTPNDDMGQGALRALNSAGRAKNSLLASIGSGAAGLKELRTNPVWVSEGAVYLDYWAGYTLAMARALKDGKKLPEITVAPQNTLTKENVDTYFSGSTPKKAPPVPEGSAYLIETGILAKLGLQGV